MLKRNHDYLLQFFVWWIRFLEEFPEKQRPYSVACKCFLRQASLLLSFWLVHVPNWRSMRVQLLWHLCTSNAWPLKKKQSDKNANFLIKIFFLQKLISLKADWLPEKKKVFKNRAKTWKKFLYTCQFSDGNNDSIGGKHEAKDKKKNFL